MNAALWFVEMLQEEGLKKGFRQLVLLRSTSPGKNSHPPTSRPPGERQPHLEGVAGEAEAQLPTHHHGLHRPPAVAAHRPPHQGAVPLHQNLHAALVRVPTSAQSQLGTGSGDVTLDVRQGYITSQHMFCQQISSVAVVEGNSECGNRFLPDMRWSPAGRKQP